MPRDNVLISYRAWPTVQSPRHLLLQTWRDCEQSFTNSLRTKMAWTNLLLSLSMTNVANEDGDTGNASKLAPGSTFLFTDIWWTVSSCLKRRAQPHISIRRKVKASFSNRACTSHHVCGWIRTKGEMTSNDRGFIDRASPRNVLGAANRHMQFSNTTSHPPRRAVCWEHGQRSRRGIHVCETDTRWTRIIKRLANTRYWTESSGALCWFI